MGIMIKASVDVYREQKGYAGMAIYLGCQPLFREGIEPAFADKIKALFLEAEETFYSTRAAINILGFTVSATRKEEFLIISRFEGRFVPFPDIITEDEDYTTGEPATPLITREEARREAEHLLRQLMDAG
jgi:hypothetical protein